MRTHPNNKSRPCEWCGNPFKGRKEKKFCNPACYHAGRSPLGYVRKAGPLEERFWRQVEKTSRCWLWTGTLIEKGYGRIRVGDKKLMAHRLSYEFANGPISNHMQVCHACDRFYPVGDTTYRRCVRPDHLFLGTNAENAADAKSKGRNARGERSGAAKFTDTQIIEMRNRYKTGGISQRKLAKEYGTSQQHLWDILHGKSWAHLPI